MKLGEAEQDINVHLLLDCSRSMAWGTPSKLLVAQQLVSALGYLAMSRSDRVLVTPFGTTLQPSFEAVSNLLPSIPAGNNIILYTVNNDSTSGALRALEDKYAPYRARPPSGPLLELAPERALHWRAS